MVVVQRARVIRRSCGPSAWLGEKENERTARLEHRSAEQHGGPVRGGSACDPVSTRSTVPSYMKMEVSRKAPPPPIHTCTVDPSILPWGPARERNRQPPPVRPKRLHAT